MVKSALIAFGVVTSIFLMFFVSLTNGILINNISLNNVNIDGLYIKYDKKLIFSIKKLKIIKSNDESETKFDPNWLIYGNRALSYFELIKIEDIDFEGEHIYVDYKDNIFNIKHQYLEFSLTQQIKNNRLKFNAYTNKIKDIKFINNYIDLDDDIKKLINEQFTFDYIELVTLNGQEKLSNITKIDENDLNIKLRIKSPQLKYPNQPIVNLNDIVITVIDGKVDISVSKSSLKDGVTFEGKIKTDIKNTKTTIAGDLYYKDIKITTNNTIENDTLNYQLSSNKFRDIKVFDKLVAIPKGIRKWAIVRLNSKSAKIDNISGKTYLKDFNVDFSTLRVDATLDDIVIDFNPKRAYPLEAKKVQVLFDGKDMNIKLTKPKSNDVDLDGSEAIVYDMFGDSGLLLKLQTISALNWTLVRAVKSYDVNIADELGVRQTKGKSDIKVKINIPFSDDPVDVFVQILNNNSIITVKDNPLKFNKFDFIYKDKKVFIKDTTLVEQGNIIDIKNLVFDINKNLLNVNLDAKDINKTFSVNLTNSTNLDQNNTKGNVNIKFVDIKDVVSIQNKTIPYRAIFGKEINAILPSLGISYQKKDNYNYLSIEDIVILEDIIIPLKQANLKSASIDLKTKDFNIIDLDIDATSKTNDLNQTFDISMLANLDLNSSSSKGNINIHKLKFQDLVDINQTDIPYSVSFKDDINLYLPSLTIEYKKKDDTNFIDINSFEKLSKIVKVMKDNNITSGSAYIKTKDFLDMAIRLNLNIEPYGIFHKTKKQKDINLDIEIEKMKKISLKDTKNMLSGNIDITKKPKINLTLNDVGIEYKTKDLNETKPVKKEPLEKCENIILDLPKVSLSMNNGYFKYNNNVVQYDKIISKTNKDKVDFILDKNNTNISLYLDGDNIYLNADKVDKNFINNGAGSVILKDGYVDLYTSGTQCNLNGRGELRNLNIKDASILNNIFLVINSAPAVINPLLIIPNAYRFATDEFQLSEYEIKKGNFNFNFNRDNSVLNIPKLNISGVHSDFNGDANIDLYSEKIKSKVDIIFMKDYAKIISYIPLVNYIVLGDEERFSYSVNIDGNLTSPDVTTHMAKETAMAPINMIKRVFMLPFLPFQDSNATK
ncbi:MAG: AsmA-like C-terminal domain-containing protein [Campylobacterota bacterium]|nr:AsmA-like C-terminal domain-containing protein [Campylobacterota bacterium]